MRAEVRADYERACGEVDGDRAFAVRLERWFTELRDPLVAVYGADERFAAAWTALLRAVARTAAERPPELRVLDHEREITPDWLHREQAVGYATYVDRFAGTLAGVRERLDYLREVFVAMAEVVLNLAAGGVDVLRLDAVPFVWKRRGTDCQNEPEVHDVVQALRAALRIAAPAVAFKAEAIVSPRQLVAYLGTGRHEGKECDLAYHNVLMVLGWSALASRRVALMTRTLRTMPPVPPLSGWVTYVRCHDDIGWAIADEDAAAVGEDGFLHRRFLADFYAGDFPGSFARGARFQSNPDTGDARTSGSAASLAGLEQGLANADDVGVELAIRRVLVLYAIA